MLGIDRDFPMTRIQRRALALGFVAWAVAGAILFGGFLPGLKPTFATTGPVIIEGHQYYYEYSQVHAPTFANYSAPWNVTFHNVTFNLWLTNWYSVTGGVLNGVGTEPNGTSYPFVLGYVLPNGSRPMFFVSPDYAFAVGWNGGWLGGIFAQLFVET